MPDSLFGDRSEWSRLKTDEYEAEAFKRVQGVVGRIVAGQHPMGVLNLLSGLPTTVWYPYKGQAERIADRIWTQLQELIAIPDLPALRRYNFEISVRDTGYNLEGKQIATIIFRYNPDDVRDLSDSPL